jgi:hypothetical protein
VSIVAEKPKDPYDKLFEPFDLEGGPPPEQRSQDAGPPERPARPTHHRGGGQPPGGIPCPSCGTHNPPTNKHCEACGARISQIPLPVAPQPLLRTTAGARALMVLAGVILTVAVLALLVNLFRGGGPGEAVDTSTTTSTTQAPVDIVQLVPIRVDCSTELADFPCSALIDDNPDNSWNAENGGIDATITFMFSPPVQITEVYIRNLPDEERFERNARVKGIEVVIDDLAQATITELADTNDPQSVQLRSLRTSSVQITVTSAYPGQSYQGREPFRELAIQEIVFYGRISPDASG